MFTQPILCPLSQCLASLRPIHHVPDELRVFIASDDAGMLSDEEYPKADNYVRGGYEREAIGGSSDRIIEGGGIKP